MLTLLSVLASAGAVFFACRTRAYLKLTQIYDDAHYARRVGRHDLADGFSDEAAAYEKRWRLR